MVVSYFSSLFSSSNLQVNFEEIFAHADFKEVLEFDWSFLNAPFTVEEVVLALKDVHLSKSPRWLSCFFLPHLLEYHWT